MPRLKGVPYSERLAKLKLWSFGDLLAECIILHNCLVHVIVSCLNCLALSCLHHLLPPVRSVSYSLRQRGHPYALLKHKYQKTKCSFTVRSIFDYL